jgi:hypothetical protein
VHRCSREGKQEAKNIEYLLMITIFNNIPSWFVYIYIFFGFCTDCFVISWLHEKKTTKSFSILFFCIWIHPCNNNEKLIFFIKIFIYEYDNFLLQKVNIILRRLPIKRNCINKIKRFLKICFFYPYFGLFRVFWIFTLIAFGFY